MDTSQLSLEAYTKELGLIASISCIIAINKCSFKHIQIYKKSNIFIMLNVYSLIDYNLLFSTK